MLIYMHMHTLRSIIREAIQDMFSESWEDPRNVTHAVKSKFDTIVDTSVEVDEPKDDDKDGDYDWERKRQKLEKRAKHNKTLRDRDTFARANVSMYSMKPLAPKSTGGAQTGRTPGGRTVSTQDRVYAAGY